MLLFIYHARLGRKALDDFFFLNLTYPGIYHWIKDEKQASVFTATLYVDQMRLAVAPDCNCFSISQKRS